MTKEEVEKLVLHSTARTLLLELPTSYGKTKLALQWMDSKKLFRKKILIVVPKLVLIPNWQDEIKKWGYERYLPNITFVTYVSFPKKAGNWDIIIWDEGHHLSERCRNAIKDFNYTFGIILSATVSKSVKWSLNTVFPSLEMIEVSQQEAMSEEVLPTPKIYLLPLNLDNVTRNAVIIKNPKMSVVKTIPYERRWTVLNIKNIQFRIPCTQRQYYDDLDSIIAWLKDQADDNPRLHQLWLHKCGERLKWLSSIKVSKIQSILSQIPKHRVITFCGSIAQTKELGKNCINSKNKEASTVLESFNNKEINHITCVDMLNEGCNLVDCQIGIFSIINASTRLQVQKVGRLLRHKQPIIILPYYRTTREEDIVKKMVEDYDESFVHTIYDIKQIDI